MEFWKPKEGAKLVILGEPPPLFKHFIPKTEECPSCGEESTTVYERSFPKGAKLCDCCWHQALRGDQ